MRIALIRHGPTDWNAQGRIQGTIDTPLSAEGRAKMAGLLPPEGFEQARPFCSPKLRARQTAQLLGLIDPTIDPRLAEQNWGKWEGLTRLEMTERYGSDCFERAGRGLAFRPPGGESTGELHARLRSFLADVAKDAGDAIAITHMGILRAGYVLATGWDLQLAMPAELNLGAALVLRLDAAGVPALDTLNSPLGIRP
jgi:broad specificity phosphatase PhoE